MKCYFVVPGLSEKYRSGGLMVIRDLAKLFAKIPVVEAGFITTEETHPEAIKLEDAPHREVLFIVTWGPLVKKHISRIRRKNPTARILYYAQSFGWGIKIPPRIPIVCVSRFVMSQWALHATENFVTHIPPPLHPVFSYSDSPRDIDILIHTRKQNRYCLQELLPALKKMPFHTEVLDTWIPQEDFSALLKRTKIFLYVTELHRAGWGRRLPGEGFGLPALEALACGALVGSNLLGGVTDFLTPGENCLKLQNGDLDFDLRQIRSAIEHFQTNEMALQRIAAEYSPQRTTERWQKLFEFCYNAPESFL